MINEIMVYKYQSIKLQISPPFQIPPLFFRIFFRREALETFYKENP